MNKKRNKKINVLFTCKITLYQFKKKQNTQKWSIALNFKNKIFEQSKTGV